MGKAIIWTILLCSLTISCGGNKQQDFVTGKVVKILDGDTYELLVGGDSTIRVKMDGIDAPERGMPFSKKARQYLGDLCQGQMVKISCVESDRYGRILSFSYLDDGRELSREMLKAGYAWHYKEHNSDPELAGLEEKARQDRRGLWQDKNPMAPWENRKLHRRGISTKGMFETTEETEE
jgi:endonuclease YncB( thermonuclease family)